MESFDIIKLGWDDFYRAGFIRHDAHGYVPARVIMKSNSRYTLLGSEGEFAAHLSGKYLHAMEAGCEAPSVGDWVAVEVNDSNAVIHALVTRKTCFARKPSISGGRKLKRGIIDGGTTARQTLAANIDTVFIVIGLDRNFSAGRIERFLTAAASSGAEPVLLLNKADLCPDPAGQLAELDRIAKDRPAHVVSAATGAGMESLAQYLAPGRTVAFLGSSGAGKSTLVNRLFGVNLQSTGEVNASTGKGRHTTSRAELFIHESGCMLIDTPGIRELQLWCDSQAVESSFEDVAAMTAKCRFNDCRHENEPGCAVREAIRSGTLSRDRFLSYMKLHSEVRHLEARKKKRDILLSRKMKRK